MEGWIIVLLQDLQIHSFHFMSACIRRSCEVDQFYQHYLYAILTFDIWDFAFQVLAFKQKVFNMCKNIKNTEVPVSELK